MHRKDRPVPPSRPPADDATRRASDAERTSRRRVDPQSAGAGEGADRTMPRRPQPEIDATMARKDTPADAGRGAAPSGDLTMRRPIDPPIDATLVQSGASDDDPLIGSVLGGCRIEKRLGAGGMGTVYRARQIELDRDVAIKTIRPEYAADTESLKRFQREAKAVGKFRTQHVVQIYAVGNERGIPYIVLELLSGGSLREFAEKQPDGRLSPQDAIRYLRQSALALADAAQKELVHRDIKPDNLLLDEQGVLKVTDFGISKMVQHDVSMTLTMGGIVGTPMYMSPEQCRGEELDFRSDMWSLGATFFFLLTAQPPAKGSSLLELIRTKNEVRNLDPSKILADAIPGPLAEVIRRLTMLDRSERYASYDDLLRDLDAIEAGRRPARSLAPLVRTLVVLALLGGGGFAVQQNWSQISAFAGGLFAKKEEPVKPSDPGNPEPVIDWEGMERDVRALPDAVDSAQDVTALNGVSDRANGLWTKIQALPPSSRTTALREDVARVKEDIGKRLVALREVEDRKGRLDQLARLRTEIEKGGDLAPSMRELDNLIAQLPPGEAWNEVRDSAKALRNQGALALYRGRFDAVASSFDHDGAASAASLSESLIADLQKESATGEFADLRQKAQALDGDIRTASTLLVKLTQAPEPKFAFIELANWAKSMDAELVGARDAAKTDNLRGWCETQRKALVGDKTRAEKVRAELAHQWTECTKARDAGDAVKVRALLDSIRAALVRVAPLCEASLDDVVSASQLDELATWLAGRSARDSLLGDLGSAAGEAKATASLGAWITSRGAADERRKALAAQLDKLGLGEDAEVKAALAGLDAEIGALRAITGRVETALGDLAAARLEKAQRELAVRDVTTRDPASIPEIAASARAVEQLRQAFVDASLELKLAAALQQFQAAETTLRQLPSSLKGAAEAGNYAGRCVERVQQLQKVTADMAPVKGGQVRIAVEQAGVDGTYDVASFFLDRFEFDRAAFKQVLDANAFPSLTQREVSELQARNWTDRPQLPVVGVSRTAASDCLARAQKVLPSHAEWWLAAKGPGDNQDFPWGKVWADGNIEPRADPLEVQLDRNPLKVGDRPVFFLVGNAAEWVDNQLAEEGRAPRGALVGGGFGYSLRSLRDAARGVLRVPPPNGRVEDSAGFRGVVRPKLFFGALFPDS